MAHLKKICMCPSFCTEAACRSHGTPEAGKAGGWERCPLQHEVYCLRGDLVLAGTWEKDNNLIFFFFFKLQHSDFPCHCLEFPSETKGIGLCC